MSAQGAHKITADFEAELCRYTGAPCAVAVDNCCNAIFLALTYWKTEMNCSLDFINGRVSDDTVHALKRIDGISCPKRTYPGVAMEIKHAGFKVSFFDGNMPGIKYMRGAYILNPAPVIDSALSFTGKMYIPGFFQCLSFTGPYKHLKLGKGGAILTDNEAAYKWFKKARFSGRSECSYHEDDFDTDPVIGWNMYMLPEIAARGLALMPQFWNSDGTPKHNDDLCLKYPDLSKFKIFQ